MELPLDLDEQQSKLGVLFEIARTRYTEEWESADHRLDALRNTLQDAIDRLPETPLPNSGDVTMTWRKAAMILWQLEAPDKPVFEKIEIENPGTPQKYALLAIYVREIAGLSPSKESFQNVTDKMRFNMAKFLLADEVKSILKSDAVASDGGEPLDESEPAQGSASASSRSSGVTNVFNVTNATHSVFGINPRQDITYNSQPGDANGRREDEG